MTYIYIYIIIKLGDPILQASPGVWGGAGPLFGPDFRVSKNARNVTNITVSAILGPLKMRPKLMLKIDLKSIRNLSEIDRFVQSGLPGLAGLAGDAPGRLRDGFGRSRTALGRLWTLQDGSGTVLDAPGRFWTLQDSSGTVLCAPARLRNGSGRSRTAPGRFWALQDGSGTVLNAPGRHRDGSGRFKTALGLFWTLQTGSGTVLDAPGQLQTVLDAPGWLRGQF